MDFLKWFRAHNVKRCQDYYGHALTLAAASQSTAKELPPLSFWGCALGGEAGEALNIIKKIERGDYVGDPHGLEEARLALAEEIADVFTYGDLLLARLGVDTAAIMLAKFNVASARVGYPHVAYNANAVV